jgi:hypothetical protein
MMVRYCLKKFIASTSNSWKASKLQSYAFSAGVPEANTPTIQLDTLDTSKEVKRARSKAIVRPARKIAILSSQSTDWGSMQLPLKCKWKDRSLFPVCVCVPQRDRSSSESFRFDMFYIMSFDV